jgi:monomeric sarcosine oxidase
LGRAGYRGGVTRSARSTDLIIVGAGLAGAAAAWAASARGRSVVVLEAFAAGHKRGSSHGSARIFRHAYADRLYVRMMARALSAWERLQEDSGEQFLRFTGGIDYGPGRDPEGLRAVVESCGVPADLLRAREAAERWPGLNFDAFDAAGGHGPGGPVMYHAAAGVLDPDRAMAAMLRLARARGADVRFGARAERVIVGGDSVTVATANGPVTAPVAIIAPGAWIAPLLEGLVDLPPLRVTQQQVFHFAPVRPPAPGAAPWPIFIHDSDDGCYYGLPGGRDGAVPGAIKLGEMGRGTVTTADARDYAVDPTERRRAIRFTARRLPGLVSEPVNEASCLFTETANEDFILDRRGPLVIASACSGHGAKFAPLTGEILAGLADGQPPPEARFTLAAHRAAGVGLSPGESSPDHADLPFTADDRGGGQLGGRLRAQPGEDGGGDGGAGALVTVVNLQRGGGAVGQRERVDALRAGLDQQAGDGHHEPPLVASGATGPLRELAHRVGDLPLRRPVGRQHQRAERPGEARQRQREQRGAAAVDPDGRDRLQGQFLDGAHDVNLQRVGRFPVGLRRPVIGDAGRQHRRVLARAVEANAGLRSAAFPDEPARGRLVKGQRGRALQVCLGEAGDVEDLADARDVVVLAGVAGRGQREQFPLQRQPGPEHRRGLQRLVGRAREHRRVGVAGGEGERPVRCHGGQRPPVPGLHEPGPDDLREYRVGVGHVKHHVQIIACASPRGWRLCPNSSDDAVIVR